MTFNSYQPSFASKLNPSPQQSNFLKTPPSNFQSNFQKSQTNKTSQIPLGSSNPSSSMNQNYLNGAPKFDQFKPKQFNFEKREQTFKTSDMLTAKSMVFMGTEKQTNSNLGQKKTFGGLGKLQSMARTVNNNFDDANGVDNNKNGNLHKSENPGNLQDSQPGTSFKKYGNTLGGDMGGFRGGFQKQQSVTASMMFLGNNDNKSNVYKSFINPSMNDNSPTQPKKFGGLDFLMKYKKEQEQKKRKEQNLGKEEKVNQQSPSHVHGDSGGKSYLNQQQMNHHKLFHEYSAPSLGHMQKNYHHEPIPIHNKNEASLKTNHGQFDSPVHNQSSHQNYTYNSKFLSPQQSAQTFMKKFNSDKVDRNPTKVNEPGTSTLPFAKTLTFAKKKIAEESSATTEENTPVKQKLVITPGFFKNRQNKVFSDGKGYENQAYSYGKAQVISEKDESPSGMKSTMSDDGSNDSVEYMDGDFSSDEVKEWSLHDFQLGDKLGKGAFGDVFVARQKNLGFMCVLKKMSKKRIKQQKREEHVIRQLKIQMYLNNKHLTAMYGYFHDNDNIYLILQYLPDGNLSQIKKRKKTSQKQTANILKQVCEGLSYMHKHNVIHRDIKPENIFVNEGYMKLGDFGCSVCTEGLRKTVVSCLEYSSPEQLSGGAYNEKIDVWGIGILAYELLTGKSPFEKEIMNMANENIDFSCIKFPPELKISELAKDFITSLLNVDPIDRLDVDEALEHKFITSNYEQLKPLQ